MDQLICDSCGRPADAEHVAARFRRLELATRYRPIHIGVLLLAVAPPPALADFFYAPEGEGSRRTLYAREFFEAMMRGVRISTAVGHDDAAKLAEFQRRGYFLAYASECPLNAGEAASQFSKEGALLPALAHTVLKRIRFSFKPKQILLFGPVLSQLIPLLCNAGWSDGLLLLDGATLDVPAAGDTAECQRFVSNLAALIGSSRANAQAL
jgi:hypothetical protein